MKNNARDLHNMLFEQMERLNDLDDDEMKSEKLLREIKRADAMNKVAAQLISNGRLALDAINLQIKKPKDINLPDMLIEKKVIEAPKLK
jgi:hypothetical protein